MATTNVKLTADTSQAQQAMSALKTGWVNAAAGMSVVEKAFNLVGSAVEKVNEALKDQGQFFSAVKDDAQMAALQISMAATDGMIKPMALAKGANVLMRGDLKLTQEQFDAVAKAAVELGRATGEDVNSVFDRLSKGVLKGSTEAFNEYGITIRATGTIHERQATILKEITSRYQGVEVSARDAGEAMEASANRAQLQLLQNGKQLDNLSQKWTRHKEYIRETWLETADYLFNSGFSQKTQVEGLLDRIANKLIADQKRLADLRQSYDRQMRIASDDLFTSEADRIRAQGRAMEIAQEMTAIQGEYVQGQRQVMTLAAQHNIEITDINARTENIEYFTARTEHLNKQISEHLSAQNVLIDAFANKVKTDIVPGLESAVNILGMLGIGYTSDADRKAAEDRKKREEAEAKRQREAAARAHEAGMQATKAYLDQQDEAAAKSLDDQLAKFGQHQDAMIALKKQKEDEEITREQLGYAEEINRKVEQQRRIDEARAEIIEQNAKKENEIKKKAEAEDLARKKEYVAKTKEIIEGLSQVTLAAIFAEKKAREGLSRTDYILKQLQAYMKAEAMKYAAKSLGYLAEGIAATFWNPPAAAAAFKASAVSAAAAAAFGGGAVAAGALGGNNKPSSSGASSRSGADAQRAEVGATEQRGSVNIIIGGSGVLWGGTVDDLMRKIQDGLNSANRRGVIRG